MGTGTWWHLRPITSTSSQVQCRCNVMFGTVFHVRLLCTLAAEGVHSIGPCCVIHCLRKAGKHSEPKTRLVFATELLRSLSAAGSTVTAFLPLAARLHSTGVWIKNQFPSPATGNGGGSWEQFTNAIVLLPLVLNLACAWRLTRWQNSIFHVFF